MDEIKIAQDLHEAEEALKRLQAQARQLQDNKDCFGAMADQPGQRQVKKHYRQQQINAAAELAQVQIAMQRKLREIQHLKDLQSDARILRSEHTVFFAGLSTVRGQVVPFPQSKADAPEVA